jgi:sugar/nucleoside kinase (ribokinase family)
VAWCIDRNYAVDHWPQEETVARIISSTDQGGCPGHNMSTGLKRLGAEFPVEAMGLVGDDEHGHHLFRICDGLGIERSQLVMRGDVETSLTLAMTEIKTGKRTFFHAANAHAQQTPDDFDFSKSQCRIVHMGLPGLHAKLDAPWADDPSGWVTILKKARAAGLKPNVELVSVEPDQIRAAALPILPYLDTLIINDFEAGAIAGIETVKDGVADAAACRKAAEVLMQRFPLALCAIHFPMGGIVLARNGDVAEHASVNVPRSEVVGSNGAGDSFAAGILFGHHEGWPILQSLKLAHASAATSLRSAATTTSILPWRDCLKQAESWGWR